METEFVDSENYFFSIFQIVVPAKDIFRLVVEKYF